MMDAVRLGFVIVQPSIPPRIIDIQNWSQGAGGNADSAASASKTEPMKICKGGVFRPCTFDFFIRLFFLFFIGSIQIQPLETRAIYLIF
ncbi:MAG: hypothetical protein ISN29_11950 [Gammaproteobacteria bacterium AqS3]|nr:hypothetical protein [Gammaproteobacteria bacterium AqS3]